jgi:hypothetical protein
MQISRFMRDFNRHSSIGELEGAREGARETAALCQQKAMDDRRRMG